MTRTAIIAAMPGELQPLVRTWRHERRNGVDLWRFRFDRGEWVAACAGAGQAAATRAFAAIEQSGPIDRVISAGWAGALAPPFRGGEVYRPSGVIDSQTGERFRVAVWSDELWLVTSPKVADGAEKRRLAAAYRGGLVDMEAAAVARLAAMRGIPFFCVKGVSDAFEDELPDFNLFLSAVGRLQLRRLLFYVLPRPKYWHALIRMGENSRKASQGMADHLLDLLDERGYIRKGNGEPTPRR